MPQTNADLKFVRIINITSAQLLVSSIRANDLCGSHKYAILTVTASRRKTEYSYDELIKNISTLVISNTNVTATELNNMQSNSSNVSNPLYAVFNTSISYKGHKYVYQVIRYTVHYEYEFPRVSDCVCMPAGVSGCA